MKASTVFRRSFRYLPLRAAKAQRIREICNTVQYQIGMPGQNIPFYRPGEYRNRQAGTGIPRHPYTIGLLGALPKLHANEDELVNISGTPPSLFSPPQQCPFESRCPWAFETCLNRQPPLFDISPDAESRHASACWYDLDKDEPRAAGQPVAEWQKEDATL